MIDIRKQEGAALVLVLVLLLVGTILINALFITVRSYIKTMPHEEGMSKAFYSADSGVEFVKANMNNINFNSINNGDYLVAEDSNNDGELEFSFTDNKYWIDSSVLEVDDMRFNIKVYSASGDPSFVSEGTYESTNDKQYNEEIKFNITAGSGLKSFNIQEKEVDDHYNESGPGNLIDHINIYDWGAEDFISFARIFLSNSFFDNGEFADDSKDIVDQYYENTNVNFEKENIDGKNIIIKNGNLRINKTEINNSILVIEGNIDFDPPKNKISNSIVIVKGNISSQGNSASADFENNMFFIYSDEANKKGYYLDFRGTGSFNINPGDLPDEYQPNLSISGWEQL